MAFSSDTSGIAQTIATPTLMNRMQDFLVNTLGFTQNRYAQRTLDDGGHVISSTGQPLELIVEKAGVGVICIEWEDYGGPPPTKGYFTIRAAHDYDEGRNSRHQPMGTGFTYDPRWCADSNYTHGVRMDLNTNAALKYWFFAENDAIIFVVGMDSSCYRVLYMGNYDRNHAGRNFVMACRGYNCNYTDLSPGRLAEQWIYPTDEYNQNTDIVVAHPSCRLTKELIEAGSQNFNDATNKFAVKFTTPVLINYGTNDWRNTGVQIPTSFDFKLKKSGSPTGNLRAILYEEYNGMPGYPVAESNVLDVSTLDGTSTWKSLTMSRHRWFIRWCAACNYWYNIGGTTFKKVAQQFIYVPRNFGANLLSMHLNKTGTPVGSVIVSVYDDAGDTPGALISSVTVPVTQITGDCWVPFYDMAASLTANTKYWIMVEGDGTYNAGVSKDGGGEVNNNFFMVGGNYYGNSFPDGRYARQSSGGSWTVETNKSLDFLVYEMSSTFSSGFVHGRNYWLVLQLESATVDGSNYVVLGDNVGTNAYKYNGSSWSALTRNLTYRVFSEYWCGRNLSGSDKAYPYMYAPKDILYGFVTETGYNLSKDTHVLFPMMMTAQKSAGGMGCWPIGQLHNIRALRLDNLTMEQSLYLGADEWIVFPNHTRSLCGIGVAIKKVT